MARVKYPSSGVGNVPDDGTSAAIQRSTFGCVTAQATCCDEVKARVALALKVIKVFLDARLLTFAFDQRLQHGFEGDLSSSRSGVAVLELNPAFVEAIQHPNSGGGILHAL